MLNDVVRIAVVSDTHHSLSAPSRIAKAAGSVDMLFHLGDNVSDVKAIAEALNVDKVVSVRGNCDGRYDAAGTEYASVKGHRIMLTHGHLHSVKTSLLRLTLAAEEQGAEAVLFGHTHISMMDFSHGMLVLNPGSAAEPRLGAPTIAILEVSKDRISPRIIKI